MIAAINAERIKLASTRSPYWCLGVVVVLGLGFAVLLGAIAGGSYGSPGETDTLTDDFLLGMLLEPMYLLMGRNFDRDDDVIGHVQKVAPRLQAGIRALGDHPLAQIARGDWDVKRMVNVEDLPARPFLELLGEMGLPTRVIDAQGDRPI